MRAKLANIMSYHVVRPVEGYEAFTTPFMAEGTVLQVRGGLSKLRLSLTVWWWGQGQLLQVGGVPELRLWWWWWGAAPQGVV